MHKRLRGRRVDGDKYYETGSSSGDTASRSEGEEIHTYTSPIRQRVAEKVLSSGSLIWQIPRTRKLRLLSRELL